LCRASGRNPFTEGAALAALAGMDASGQTALIDIEANFLTTTLVPFVKGGRPRRAPVARL
jgi:hypothetical protein